MTATMATINPLGYRGYVLDIGTYLYYCQSRYYDPAVGRFINADGLVSTGQGFTGNNMFAYCSNNPVNRADPTGECWHNGLPFVPCDECKEKAKEQRKKFLEDVINFNLFNSSEEVVLESNYFSMYKGSPVLKLPIGDNAFSFGMIFLGQDTDDTETVQHEYGHFVQYCILGPVDYFICIAVPSLHGYWTEVAYDEYYSQPWEYGADLFGGVKREEYEYGENAESSFWAFWISAQEHAFWTIP